jgi:hypothetical protein
LTRKAHMNKVEKGSFTATNLRLANRLWGPLSSPARVSLIDLTDRYLLQVASGDLLYLSGRWYVTHSGLLRIANRNRCRGIRVQPVREFCDTAAGRWAFKATVFRSATCKGFVGFGDADPTNVSSVVHGAEMRIAETRAVNRALRKAYGIGICSVEELGATTGPAAGSVQKRPPQSAINNGTNGHTRVRDRLCQLIRQHGLDAALVKSYAIDFCHVANLKDAKRDQVEAFVHHLSECAAKDRDALLCQLNTYQPPQQGAA